MSKVDWSKAPDGAEFFNIHNKVFYRTLGGESQVFCHSGWCRSGFSAAKLADTANFIPLITTELLSDERCQPVEQHDPVNKPKHYAIAPDVEAIDIIRSTLTPEQFKGYLLGNFLKYRLRAGDKGDLQQDIDKSNWYKRELNK